MNRGVLNKPPSCFIGFWRKWASFTIFGAIARKLVMNRRDNGCAHHAAMI